MTVPVFSSRESKAYPLIVGSLPINVYCHMENRSGNGACGDGGWTLVMKIDGNEVLRNYTNVMYCWNGGTIIDIITLYNYSGACAIREILVVTSAYVLPSARTDSGGGGEESQDNPRGGGECHLFLAGNCAVLLGNRRFLGGKSHDRRHF